ncbi:MAG: hypothetical protein ACXWU0_11325, partial [Rhodoplanes sp.]
KAASGGLFLFPISLPTNPGGVAARSSGRVHHGDTFLPREKRRRELPAATSFTRLIPATMIRMLFTRGESPGSFAASVAWSCSAA